MSETAQQDFPEALDTTIIADPEPASTAEATTAEADAVKPAPEEETQAEKDAKRILWLEKSVAKTRFEASEARRQRDALQARAAQPTPQPSPTFTGAVVPAAQVEAYAAQMVAEEAHKDACNEVAETGRAAYKDFDTAINNIGMIGEIPRPFLEGITALGKDDGAKVFYELGKNPEEAERIWQLSPARMAVALAKLAAAPVKLAPVSRAPAPIEPIAGTRAVSGAEPSDKNDAAWTDWYKKGLRERTHR